MTDTSIYKNLSLRHDKYKIATILSKGKLVKDGDISRSKVVEILLTREAKAQGISEKDIEKVEIGHRKKKRKFNVREKQMYSISNEDRQEILKYLSTQPYANVFKLVAMIVNLKKAPASDKNGKEKEVKKN